MGTDLYFPTDDFDFSNPNFDSSSDFVELSAFFSEGSQAYTKDLVGAFEISTDEDYKDVEEEIRYREEIVSGTVRNIEYRKKSLNDAYPFELDETGDTLYFLGDDFSFGRSAYLLSLVLSHLKSVSPILNGSRRYPSDVEIRELRQYFQYFATAALAAEIGGQAWSFGHPRPDGTGFLTKLREIWLTLKDGTVDPDPSAPSSPQDDQIDIFAWRGHPDGLPGFILAGAQVATGANWKSKSIKEHVADVFWGRWFGRQPVSQLICYHIIPFARPIITFRDDVLVLGNVMHRLRLPYRVNEAVRLHKSGTSIEAFDELPNAVEWIKDYWKRGLANK